MQRSAFFSFFMLAALAACDGGDRANQAEAIVEDIRPVSESDATKNEFGFWAAESAGPDPFGQNAPSAEAIAGRTNAKPIDPQAADNQASVTAANVQTSIAYSYGFGFQIEKEKIADLQKAHLQICSNLGSKCRVLRMSQAGSEGWDGYGELDLQVEASQAQAFGDALSQPAEELGGEQVSSVVDGEDLSETIIDNEARLTSRIVLRDKLTDILRSSSGSVDELVKAEQAVAEVNQEIDATRSKLKELRNRLRYSAVSIQYNTSYEDNQIGFVQPVWTAVSSIGSTLGMTVAVLVYLITALVPITLLILALRWILHRFGLRLRFWKKHPTPTVAD